jgi:hypothetical protein
MHKMAAEDTRVFPLAEFACSTNLCSTVWTRSCTVLAICVMLVTNPLPIIQVDTFVDRNAKLMHVRYDSFASDKVTFPSVRLVLPRGLSGQTARIETLPNMKRAGAHPCAVMFLSNDGNH